MSDDCIFCKIIAGKIPSYCVYQDENTFAFLDINPLNNGHVLVIPKHHCRLTHEMSEEDATAVMKTVVKVSGAVAKATGKDYNILNNNGPLAGQEVQHVHYHIIPKDNENGLPHIWNPIKDKAPMEETLKAIQSKL